MNDRVVHRLVLMLTVMMCLVFIGAASALDPDDPEYWTDMGDGSLHKGETYRVNNYTVKFTDYVPETDLVYLKLSRGDELLDESCLNASCVNETTFRADPDTGVCDWWNWDDEVVIAILNETEDYPESGSPTYWGDPGIHIEFYERAKPEISLEITTGCEVYTPKDSEIRVTVEIENTGDAELENVGIAIDPGDLQAISDLTEHFGNLLARDEDDRYLWFNWNDVPRNTNEEDQFLKHLWDDLGFDWTRNANSYIGKSRNDDTITINRGNDSAEIRLSSDHKTATLDIGNDTHSYDVEDVGGDLNVYIVEDDAVDTVETIYATLRVPKSITDREGQPYTITVNVTGFDEKGVMCTESASTEILVLPRFDLKLTKTVNDHISMDQSAWVRIDLENTGRRDLEVRLNDTVPTGFRLCGNETPGWRFNITPSESLRFSYHIKPERPGIFEVPGAVAEFVMGETNISVRSNGPVITVDGVCITVNKTAHPEQIQEGDTVTVTLSVRNTGNMDATINLTDVLPPGAELISGDPTIQTLLAANQTNETEYVMSIANPGQVVLGAPWVSLSGSGYCYTASTDVPVIEVTGLAEEPSVMPTSMPTGDSTLDTRTSLRMVDVSFYETLLVMCMFAGVFLIGRFMRWR